MIINAQIPAKPLDLHPDGTAEVFSFCDFVESSDKWLWCSLCEEDFTYRLPDTMKTGQVRCACCSHIGNVTHPPVRRDY